MKPCEYNAEGKHSAAVLHDVELFIEIDLGKLVAWEVDRLEGGLKGFEALTPVRRVEIVVDDIIASAMKDSDKNFYVALDYPRSVADSEDLPCAMLMANGAREWTVPLNWTQRALVIGPSRYVDESTVVCWDLDNCNADMLDALLVRIARFFRGQYMAGVKDGSTRRLTDVIWARKCKAEGRRQ